MILTKSNVESKGSPGNTILTSRQRSPPGLSPNTVAVGSNPAVAAPAAVVPPIFTIAEDDDDAIAERQVINSKTT